MAIVKNEMFVHIGKDHTNNNKPFVAIVDRHCIPVTAWVSNYLTIGLSGLAFNTSKLYAHQLKSVLEHFQRKGIDIESRAKSGKFFDVAELRSFFDSCKYKSHDETNVVSIDVNSDKSVENAVNSNRIAGQLSKGATAKGKIKRLKSFLSFMYMHMHADNIVSEDVKHRYELALTYLTDSLTKLKDFNMECVGQAESPLPSAAFFKLLDIIRVDSPDNPFKRSKFRNHLMVMMYIETGNRLGDHASLKVEDMKFEGTGDEIAIVRRPNDASDTRRYSPSTKTDAHMSYVPPDLMKQVKSYINNVREKYTRAQGHEFVFVTENNNKGTEGEPLSLSSITKIFEKLSGIIGFKIHCHLLRHKFNEILTELAEEQGLSSDETDKMRKYMMGWSRDSQMAEKYNRFKIYKASQSLSRGFQDKMTNREDTL